MSWSQNGAFLGLGLAVLSLLLLAVGPLGWRMGWWHYRFAFSWLMPASGISAVAAALVAVLSVLLGWSQFDLKGTMTALVALLMGVALAYVPWQYNRTRGTVPRIHDITTDTDHPPEFIA